MGRFERSSKLRFTQRLADICDFVYDYRKNVYGGCFQVFQLEKIVKVIEDQKVKIEELTAELELLKAQREG